MKILAVLVLFASVSANAAAVWMEEFEQIKHVARSFEDSGSICEEVAKLEVEKEFPTPQYSVLVGIAYGDEKRVVGELDIVIFDNNLQKVIKIAEVKCWKDLKAGLEKAKEQRARFLTAIRSSKKIIFRSTSTQELFDSEKFKYVKDFYSVAQRGSMAVGFDRELKLSLLELRDLRYEMIRCQVNGLCPRH